MSIPFDWSTNILFSWTTKFTSINLNHTNAKQGHHHKENLDAPCAMVDRSCPLGGDRVKESENLAATAVAPGAPVDTSLQSAAKWF